MLTELMLPSESGVAGVDEAGRGPLVGDVVAAAVVLNPDAPIAGLNDSKKLSEKRREVLAEIIKSESIAWSIGVASPAEVDQLNVLHASMLAMKRAVEGLSVPVVRALVDGNRVPKLACPAEAVIKGDGKVASIAAASILAKVYRDQQMYELDEQYPQYGFSSHKGYPTKFHLEKLAEHGVLMQVYRLSFGPVKRLLEESAL